MEKDDRYTRITLRIPKDLHAQLAEAADATSKSMNAEIIARLEESFAGSTPPPTSEAAPRTEQEAQELVHQLQEIAQMFQDAAKWLPRNKE